MTQMGEPALTRMPRIRHKPAQHADSLLCGFIRSRMTRSLRGCKLIGTVPLAVWNVSGQHTFHLDKGREQRKKVAPALAFYVGEPAPVSAAGLPGMLPNMEAA